MTIASDHDTLLALAPDKFVARVSKEPGLQEDPVVKRRHDALLDNASVCSYCGVGCPFTVEADSGGRPRIHPLSSLGLCVKGKTSIQTGGHQERARKLTARDLPDDRIREPMLRGHDGKMKVVSWDEALDRAAWLFLHAREWVGPEAVAIYGNGQKTIEAIWMASLYRLVFRLPTIGANSEHCLTSAGAAHVLNFGNEASFTSSQFDELAQCDVAVLHGTNPYVTFPQAYEKLKRNTKAIKVVIDPTLSDTVSDLQEHDERTLHIRFRQGGDVLFNLAVSRIILENGWQDAESIAEQIDPASQATFEALCDEPRCEPAEAARRIALPEQDHGELITVMHRYAALIAQPIDGYRPRVAFVSSMGVNQSTGSYGFSTNLNLLLLTGNVGRAGAGSLRIAGQSNATSELMMGFNARKLLFNLDPTDPAHRRRLASLLELPENNLPDTPGTSVASMADDDRIYCFLFVGTQMTKNMPRVGHWTRRLGRSFNIVIDSFLGEGVLEHADVVLPSFTYTERTGVIQRGDRTLQLQQQLTTPPAQAWSDSQILARLALKIAERLRDPDTAALNGLDPNVVHRTFARYLDEQGNAVPARIFDHVVQINRALELYSRLEDDQGTPISHTMLRSRAGKGVQWGGNQRYHPRTGSPSTFPGLHCAQQAKAKLVRPPDDFLDRLEAPLAPGELSLISGRGRPGRRALKGRGRYNSGIKTLPIYGRDPDEHVVELPDQALQALGLTDGLPARLLSEHGLVFAQVATNHRIALGTAFIDFVPGEVNRLTDYVEADRFTHQSLIKRTPVAIRPLQALEKRLWARPDEEAFCEAVDRLFADWRTNFPGQDDWLQTQRDAPGTIVWLPPELLRAAELGGDARLNDAVGALVVFFQQYLSKPDYRKAAAPMLHGLPRIARDRFLRILLPLLRRFDYQHVLHPLLADIVGNVTVIDDHNEAVSIDLLTAHKSAVLEFKEEIVAIQLFIAIKQGLARLFDAGTQIRREDLAFISGVAIPCAGDVPAHFLGISPADLDATLLIHSRAIGMGAVAIVDRKTGRAVRVNVTTGVLPKDKELGKLRGLVINRKRDAGPREHSRFFDRLGELIVDYVRTGDDNFEIHGPVEFDWQEYRAKLAFAPAGRREFGDHLTRQRVSGSLARSLTSLGVLDAERDAKLLLALRDNPTSHEPAGPALTAGELYSGDLTARVNRVVDSIIAPVLANDGGRLDLLDINESTGELQVRFVGSCANCPYSLLSMEQIVKPTLLAIPGVTAVTHRAKAKSKDIEQAGLGSGEGVASLQSPGQRRAIPIVSD